MNFSWNAVGSLLVMATLVAVGIWVSKLTTGEIGAMFIVITIGALISTPGPRSRSPVTMVSEVDLLAVCTLVLSTAGPRLGKDLPMPKAIGWKIIPVGLVSITSAHLLASTVAQFALNAWN